MMSNRSPSPEPRRCNGHHRLAPVEPLSARIFRLRIARGYSINELATAAGILASTIQRLESGKSVDKRVLRALATALGVPLCQLACGEHSCVNRASWQPEGRIRQRTGNFAPIGTIDGGNVANNRSASDDDRKVCFVLVSGHGVAASEHPNPGGP